MSLDNTSETNNATSLGSYLQWERQKKQLSIEEVAKSTRVPIDVLQAIEAGNQSSMPAPVFVKGFLKIYADFLGLDQLDVLERYRTEWDTTTPEPSPEALGEESMAQSTPFLLSGRFALLIIVLLAILACAYFFFKANDLGAPLALKKQIIPPAQSTETAMVIATTTPRTTTIGPELGPQTTLLIPCQSAGKIDPEEGEQTDTKHSAVHPQKVIAHNIPVPQPSPMSTATTPILPTMEPNTIQRITPVAANEPEENVAHITAQALPVDLHIRFTKKTHITVSQDNQGSEEYLFAAGEESSWQADTFISVNVENGSAVEVTVNGNPMPVTSQNDQPLIFTLPPDVT